MMKKGLICITILLLLLQAPFMGYTSAHAEDKDDDVKNILDSLFGTPKEDEEEANEDQEGTAEEETRTIEKLVGESYGDILQVWKDNGIEDAPTFSQAIHPKEFKGTKGQLQSAKDSQGYEQDTMIWNEQLQEIELDITVPNEGLYQIKVDYFADQERIIPPERSIQINGEYQYFESRRFYFPGVWQNAIIPFEQDALGNEIPSNQKNIKMWQSTYLMDSSYLFAEPLRFHLKKGKNAIKLQYLREDMVLGSITVQSPNKFPSYDEYKKQQNGELIADSFQSIEAEWPTYKSDPSIQAVPSADPNVTPNKSGVIRLNSLGGETWKDGGQKAVWEIEVDQSGYYHLAFKYFQNFKINMPVYRTLEINGDVPFQEVLHYPFQYSKKWENEIISDASGKPFQFYLEKGKNKIALTANPAPLQPIVKTVRDVMGEVNEISLEIKQATGNIADRNRDWNIIEQIPNISDRLNELAENLAEQYNYLKELSGRDPDQARNLMMAAEQLKSLAEDPNSIPFRYKQLSEGAGSVLQMLGDLLIELPKQPLQLDKVYIYGNEKLPRAEATIWAKASANFLSFIKSFTTDYTQISPVDDDTVQVWVNRPRQYVMLMQQMVNRDFTPKTGIKVSLSLMPEEQKLILANAADKTPDIALGIGNEFPFNLALRGALKDLSEYKDFPQVLDRFSSGALLPFMINDKYYAIPDTQSFNVLFYRQDILDALNIPVPETWDDVINILPELQRFGMNFYLPLSSSGGYKPFAQTVPYLYQFGANLYSEDGTKSAIDTDEALEAFDLMTKSFTIYSMPLQVPSFYNHFREGSLPIGVADFSTYLQLTAAAPEIAGLWKIAPHPGVKDENGEIVRWAPGTGAAGVIFNKSNKQDDAWEFMKWWTSTETQIEFGTMIETIYGLEYRWNSSNIEAFAQLPWPQDDLDVILDQWKWLRDIPRIPGDYMVERELSNAWNKAVFDGENARRALEDGAITANREILKKLHEFDYMKDGEMVKELKVPQLKKQDKRGEKK
ncbi:extracellular solute-binding protein [Pseudogracilibacillus auburnensis]|uniref:extracellular solute-binding protein n=1 Tax=Pseudogracilibacillus auburnensis TaxID=1494959 RepID=UPI001A96DC59|nr:extracellular solute-binding protein [Pseudogracilibacillus auburnensis]MBO1004835.1 extracellular solute-binding protein [Pseudogracilibacillus auburnensis]